MKHIITNLDLTDSEQFHFDKMADDYESLLTETTKSILITNDTGRTDKPMVYYARIMRGSIDFREKIENIKYYYHLDFIRKLFLVNDLNGSKEEFNRFLQKLKQAGEDIKSNAAVLFKEGNEQN